MTIYVLRMRQNVWAQTLGNLSLSITPRGANRRIVRPLWVTFNYRIT
jgi:hypothetical protein